jgi:hypothetical protein
VSLRGLGCGSGGVSMTKIKIFDPNIHPQEAIKWWAVADLTQHVAYPTWKPVIPPNFHSPVTRLLSMLPLLDEHRWLHVGFDCIEHLAKQVGFSSMDSLYWVRQKVLGPSLRTDAAHMAMLFFKREMNGSRYPALHILKAVESLVHKQEKRMVFLVSLRGVLLQTFGSALEYQEQTSLLSREIEWQMNRCLFYLDQIADWRMQ